MSSIAICPGTFDPVTLGHVDIVKRASTLFDEILVAIAPTIRKTFYFSLEERLALTTEVFKTYPNIRVLPLEGLLVDFARQQGARIIVRGLRTMSDFEYEFQLARMNDRLMPEIESLFLLAKHEHSYISSSIVKEIMELGGDISPFVPVAVTKYLKEKQR
jgi:pantetheine-phosphate adenylyltransferase